MRRKIFYLSVALLAFGVGSMVVFSFYWKAQSQILLPAIGKSTAEVKSETIDAEDDIFGESGDAPVRERILELVDDWLDKKKVEKYVEVKPDDSVGAMTFRVHTEMIDVNGDNIEELVVRYDCAAVGNCELLIFQKYMHGYNVILRTGMVQTFKLGKSKTKSYFDLETKTHGDAFSGGITVYKFDGKEYKASACSDYNYSELKDGKFYILIKPKITSRECDKQS